MNQAVNFTFSGLKLRKGKRSLMTGWLDWILHSHTDDYYRCRKDKEEKKSKSMRPELWNVLLLGTHQSKKQESGGAWGQKDVNTHQHVTRFTSGWHAVICAMTEQLSNHVFAGGKCDLYVRFWWLTRSDTDVAVFCYSVLRKQAWFMRIRAHIPSKC